jgi:hypothetical protein
MTAFINEQPVEDSIPTEFIDHHFFYTECPPGSQTKVGKYTSGIAREAVVDLLRRYQEPIVDKKTRRREYRRW